MTKMTNKKFKSQIRLNKLKAELDEYRVLIQKYDKEFKADGNVDAEEQAFLNKLSITLSKLNARVTRLQLKLKDRTYTDEQLQPKKEDVTPADQVVFPRDNMNYGVEDNSDPDISTAEGYFADTTVSGTMQASVGVAGANIDTDIRLVQEALNVTIDGDCGPKTIAAIKAFQHKLRVANATTLGEIKQHSQGQLEFSISQGLIEVGDMTYKALFEGQMTLVNDGTFTIEDDSFTTDDNGQLDDGTYTIEDDTFTTDDNGQLDDGTYTIEDDTPIVDTSIVAKTINASVGKGGVNDKEDVKVVQSLLNGHGSSLVVDGGCGSKTIKAIMIFQKNKLHFRNPDGLISAGGTTWKGLLGNATPIVEEDTDEEDNTPAGGRVTPSWLAEAKRNLGQKATARMLKDDPYVSALFKEQGNVYNEWAKFQTTFAANWCAAFVSHCLRKGGQTPLSGYDGVRAKKYQNYGRVISKPVYGAIAVLTRSGGGHVAFVVDASGENLKNIRILGGNQGNAVTVKDETLSNVLAYVVPTGWKIPPGNHFKE